MLYFKGLRRKTPKNFYVSTRKKKRFIEIYRKAIIIVRSYENKRLSNLEAGVQSRFSKFFQIGLLSFITNCTPAPPPQPDGLDIFFEKYRIANDICQPAKTDLHWMDLCYYNTVVPALNQSRARIAPLIQLALQTNVDLERRWNDHKISFKDFEKQEHENNEDMFAAIKTLNHRLSEIHEQFQEAHDQQAAESLRLGLSMMAAT